MSRRDTVKELTEIIAKNLRLGIRALTPERHLMASLGVSRHEIKSAIAILKAKGMVEPRRGSGVYLTGGGNPGAETAKRRRVSIAVGFLCRLNPGDIFYRKLLDALEAAAERHGVELSFHGDLKRAENRDKLKERIIAGEIKGFLAVPEVPGQFTLELAALTPTVGIGGTLNCGRSINCVEVNHHSCGVVAAAHLIKQGCHVLGYISDLPLEITCQEQLSGMRATAALCGGRLDNDFIKVIPRREAATQKKSSHLWQQLAGVDGFLVRDDLMADLVVRQFAAAGVHVPEDVKIVGVNNYTAGRTFKIPLTSVDMRLDVVCSEAIGIVKKQRSSRNRKVIQILVEPELVARQSTTNITDCPRPPSAAGKPNTASTSGTTHNRIAP